MSDEKKDDFLTPEQLARIELTKRENTSSEFNFELERADTPPDLLPDLQPAEPAPPAKPTPPPAPTVVMPVVKLPPTPEPPAQAAPPPSSASSGPPPSTVKMPAFKPSSLPTAPSLKPAPPPAPKPAPKPEPALATDVEVKPTQPPTGGMPPRRPEWKNLEPEDQSDPVPHEQYEEHDLQPDWRLLCASVRGKLHAHKGSWRDDAYRWAVADQWTILAVADGAGSASLSRVASRIACDIAVKKLQELLAGHTLGAADKQPSDNDLKRLRSFLATAAEKARLNVVTESQRRKVSLKEFGTTLVLLVHTAWQGKELVAALQVGDGAIGMIAADGFRRLGFSDQGEYSSETRFLTSPGIELEFENRVVFSVQSKIKAMALMTDGVSDDFYPEDTKLIELFEANPIGGIASKSDEPVLGLLHGMTRESTGATLRDWLRYEKRGSSDDRTLLLMFRS